MSETTNTDPVPNAPSVDPPAPTPAPVSPPPAPVSPEPTEQTEQTEEEKKAAARDEEGRRVAALRARLGAAERERDRLAAEAEFWRNQQPRQPETPPTPEQQHQRLVAEIRTQEAARMRAERFHEDGRAEFPDWGQRCSDLMQMGADPEFAALLVDMPGGAKVAAALAKEPEEVQRIAGIATERGRAVALGRFAATLEQGNGAARPPAPVTRAPPPIRPVTGRAAPQFNEYTASAQELADHYMRQDLERRQRR
jgi:hypothetical protein